MTNDSVDCSNIIAPSRLDDCRLHQFQDRKIFTSLSAVSIIRQCCNFSLLIVANPVVKSDQSDFHYLLGYYNAMNQSDWPYIPLCAVAYFYRGSLAALRASGV